VTFSVTLFFVLAAVYGLVSASLSVLVAAAWRAIHERAQPSANELLALRLLPAGGATLLALTVVLPAFLVSEPAHELEEGGPLLVSLALFGLLTVGIGLRRASRAWKAARVVLQNCGPADVRCLVAGQPIDIVDAPEPFVAVIGGLRPRIVASKRVLAACSNEEFGQVIAHEAAHISSRDNLKLLLLVLGPDPLAWLPAGAALEARWRKEVEREADERATGADRYKRLALASALIKVARLSSATPSPLPALSLPIAVDDVEGRVRGLLAQSPPNRPMKRIWGLAVCSLVIPVLGVPFYGVVHQFIEALVAFGR
jgi:Zn-dependent protease with chaperone function